MGKRATEFQTIRSEGGLLPPDLLRRVVDPAGKVSGVEPTAYGLPAGERLNEAITQSWNRLRRCWAEFRAAVPTSSLDTRPSSDAFTGLTNDKWSLPLLRELGFGFLTTTAGPTIDGKTYAISRFAGNTAIHLVGCGVSLDHRAAGVRGAAVGNPHGLVQEFLNRSPGHLWAIVSNGISFRILRDNQALSRQSFLEFDLEAMFDGQVYSDFVLLWLIAHATRYLPRNDGRPDSCWLETWSKEAAEQGVAALTDLRGGVEKALEILGQGFVSHPKNTVLRDALRKGDVKLSDFHGQLLRIVYRLIFLFVAEDRELEGISLLHPREGGTGDEGRVNDPAPSSLVPSSSSPVPRPSALATARERYTTHYSTSRLRELASRIKGSRHGDLWRQFQLLVGALSGEDRFAAMRAALALPPLGSMLWNPASTALLKGPGLAAPTSLVPSASALDTRPSSLVTSPQGTELSNVDFLEALRHLAFIRKDKILRPVDYKNLGSEEFGGVYESFLALTPQISSDGARFTFAEFAGNERKTSGSYYTPDSLVQCLLDSALDPVVNERLADAERLAKADWPAVEKETQSDPAKRTYVLAFLTKHAGASKTATAEDRKRAWDSVPPSPRRWKLSEEAILAIKVCDMACGSGHFLVGAGHRLARHLARVRALAQGESEPSPLLYQTALRDVIGHCLYGVDINPMAVELCKVTLWLEAMEPGKPLSFLDHHIRCGNSLLGATPELIKGGIPDEAYEAIEGDDKEACSALKKQNKRENPKLGDWFIADEAAIRDKLFQAATAIDEMGDSRPEDIHRKEAAFRNAQQNYDFQKAWDLANLWCAAFVIKKRFPASASEISNLKSEVVASLDAQPLATQGGLFGGTEEMPKAKGKRAAVPRSSSLVPPYGITTQHLRDFVEGGALPDGLLSEAKRLADQYQFFHWHLAFPEVFTQGGFDVFLGNPPWDHVEIKEKEWFAERCPQIASAANDSARKRLIEALRLEQPSVFTQFQDALRQIEGESHMLRNSGAYPLCGLGRINLYAVFAERTYRLRAPEGASGMVMPTGLVTLDNNKGFFKELMELNRLRAFVGFDNEEKTIFPDIDNNLTFAAVTIGKNRGQAPKFCFNIRQFEQLQESDRFFELSSDDLTLLNPNTRTCPSFRSSRDAELTRTLYRRMTITMRETPQETNVWGIRFKQGLFKMATDSNLFSTREQLESEGWRLEGNEFQRDGQRMLPLYEAKMIWHFEHRWASFFGREMTDGRPSRKYVGWYGAQYEKPDDFAMGRYWVPANEVVDRSGDAGDYFVSFRDIANRDLERTGVFAVLPKVGVGHQAPLIYFANKDRNSVAAFVAERNSFVADFLTRNKMDGSHLSFFILKQLPTLPPSVYSTPCAWMNAAIHVEDWILQHVLELTYTAWDLEAFAQDCGWSGPPFRWDDARRFLLRCELDAAFFHLYLGPNSDWGMANGAAGAESPSSPVPRPSSPALLAAFPTPRDAASYIMDTFPIVKRKDEAKFNGDYRTKRTILEIYDALAEAMKTGTPYQTRLNPAPADASCRHPKKKVGILAFGSLITDPGKELLPKITMRIKTLTPFGVEYGRISQTRGGAPTLVPHEAGTPVEGEILVLDDAVSVEEARNMVWRRERRKEGTGETYFQGTSPNSVLVRDCNESPCVKHVLYTDFNPDGKVAQPQAADLARQAIQSVKAAKEGMDGITYLKNNLASGIKTKLTPDYEAEILKQTKANSLEEAHRKLRLS